MAQTCAQCIKRKWVGTSKARPPNFERLGDDCLTSMDLIGVAGSVTWSVTRPTGTKANTEMVLAYKVRF